MSKSSAIANLEERNLQHEKGGREKKREGGKKAKEK